MNKQRNSKGITLIALVITIVVLVILAGVTINVAVNGGLIGNSKAVSKEYSREQYKEQLQICLSDAAIEYYSTNNSVITDKNLIINEKISDQIEDVAIAGDFVKIGEYIFKIDRQNNQVIEEVEFKNIKEFTVETATAEAINNTINNNEYNYIHFSEGQYVLDRPIKIIDRNDLYIKLDQGAEFKLNYTGKAGIKIEQSSNIFIDGGKIDGMETATTGEYDAKLSSIFIGCDETDGNSSNIIIENMVITNGKCAGIYVGAGGGAEGSTAVVEGVGINNVTVENNYLGQGIALTSAQNVNILDCKFKNIYARNRS